MRHDREATLYLWLTSRRNRGKAIPPGLLPSPMEVYWDDHRDLGRMTVLQFVALMRYRERGVR